MNAQRLSQDFARLDGVPEEHRASISHFYRSLTRHVHEGLLTIEQADIVREHLLRLAERGSNPANTGNIEDLFCFTLRDTGDSVRAFAQALADCMKVVPMDDEAWLHPRLRSLDGTRTFSQVKDLTHLGPADKMLVAHTMVAYGDADMRGFAKGMIRATSPRLDDVGVEQEFAKMVVQSQHHPSSTFVLARASGLTLEVPPVYEAAGYSEGSIRDAQAFYDICARFEPGWSESFADGVIPRVPAWLDWRAAYLDARSKLPLDLLYQLVSDTLTNFLDGTMESGKWTDASVVFGEAHSATDVLPALARIVNRYIAEHIALHDRTAYELIRECTPHLAPWGIGFEGESAVVMPGLPERFDSVKAQFEAAWRRREAMDGAIRSAL